MDVWTEGGTEGGIEEGTEKGTEQWRVHWMEWRKEDLERLNEEEMEAEIEEWMEGETEMELIHFIKEKIYHLGLEHFLSRYLSSNVFPVDKMKTYVNKLETFLSTTTFGMQEEEAKVTIFHYLVFLARLVRDFVGKIVPRFSGKKFTSSERDQQFTVSEMDELCRNWKNIVKILWQVKKICKDWEDKNEKNMQFMSKVIDAVRNPPIDLKILPKLLLDDTEDSSNCITQNLGNAELLLIKAFPALGELKESSEMLNFLLEVTTELKGNIELICQLCKQISPAVLLIGTLLSFKQPHSHTWNRVYHDLRNAIGIGYNYKYGHMGRIFSYCVDDLPEFIQPCFLYLACYPIDYEIPATCLAKIWIAEGFVKVQKGETLEETANKYLEELVERLLVLVSMRSYSGTIKYCRVPRSIHKYLTYKANEAGFWMTPYRVAVHGGNNDQSTEEKVKPVRSFLAFHLDRDVLASVIYCTYLRVLHVRNSTIRETYLPKLRHLQYMGLRGSNIRMLPKNIGDMKDLQTLDVRDTSIETLPESLWSILTLRHVYANPRPQIQGPPLKANLSNLQTLKTVVVPKSWLENFPHSLINLRKLALSNMDNPACKPNPYWKSVSNLLSHVVNLLSMTIIGDIVPAEFVDTRAFPNLETVKSIKLEGKWNYLKLPIDNNKFPSNLAKLILTKSGLKEDPMRSLERLQVLKYLTLKDGAYMGKKIVCSENGFPQLHFLELSELKNLEIWEADPTAMPQLTKLRVVKCCKLENLPDLEHVTDKDIVM